MRCIQSLDICSTEMPPNNFTMDEIAAEVLMKHFPGNMLIPIPLHPQTQSLIKRPGEFFGDVSKKDVPNRILVARVWKALDSPRLPVLVPNYSYLWADGVVSTHVQPWPHRSGTGIGERYLLRAKWGRCACW